MLPSHKKAMEAIVNCRTEYYGGEVYLCEPCNAFHHSYHSCKNRSCPKCGHEKAQAWLTQQQARLLPVTYFMATFTLHDQLRKLARSHQRLIYNLLFRASAAALQKLARDPEFIGGQIGMVGMLQTWQRNLRFLHPHIHFIVPGGGLSKDGSQWLPARHNYLMPHKALADIFRAKFRQLLKKADRQLHDAIPREVWRKRWVVGIKAVGSGEHALKYLAPYIFQVAISNKRLKKLQDGKVTFTYTDSNTKEQKNETIPAEEFIAKFLEHVLPRRFVKVRAYGLLHSHNRALFERARELLAVENSITETQSSGEQQAQAPEEPMEKKPKTLPCPKCGKDMRWIKELPPKKTNTMLKARAP